MIEIHARLIPDSRHLLPVSPLPARAYVNGARLAGGAPRGSARTTPRGAALRPVRAAHFRPRRRAEKAARRRARPRQRAYSPAPRPLGARGRGQGGGAGGLSNKGDNSAKRAFCAFSGAHRRVAPQGARSERRARARNSAKHPRAFCAVSPHLVPPPPQTRGGKSPFPDCPIFWTSQDLRVFLAFWRELCYNFIE